MSGNSASATKGTMIRNNLRNLFARLNAEETAPAVSSVLSLKEQVRKDLLALEREEAAKQKQAQQLAERAAQELERNLNDRKVIEASIKRLEESRARTAKYEQEYKAALKKLHQEELSSEEFYSKALNRLHGLDQTPEPKPQPTPAPRPVAAPTPVAAPKPAPAPAPTWAEQPVVEKTAYVPLVEQPEEEAFEEAPDPNALGSRAGLEALRASLS